VNENGEVVQSPSQDSLEEPQKNHEKRLHV
jgi:hypothetical protein